MVYEILTALNETFGCLRSDSSVTGTNIATQAELEKAAHAMNFTVEQGCSAALTFLRHMQLCPFDISGEGASFSNSMGVLATNITGPQVKAFEKNLCKYEPGVDQKLFNVVMIALAASFALVFLCLIAGMVKCCNDQLRKHRFFSSKKDENPTSSTPLLEMGSLSSSAPLSR